MVQKECRESVIIVDIQHDFSIKAPVAIGARIDLLPALAYPELPSIPPQCDIEQRWPMHAVVTKEEAPTVSEFYSTKADEVPDE
jgi:hypothetical protein